jgi:D-alanine-D-alanine ligase/UDP-N-acetylmuramate--alanine ligase
MSGRAVSDHLNRAFYQVEHFLITKQGEWHQYNQFPDCDGGQGKCLGANYEDLIDCDILFPILHGSYGEDGTMQGFFEILGKAYVGCDHRSSANCMDKALTKTICQHQGIKTPKFIHFTHYDWKCERKSINEQIIDQLFFPVFVKGCHMGSSVGLYKVLCKEDLEEKVDQAFVYDRKVIVEEGIVGREIEFAVYGNEKAHAFPPGEVITNGEVYDYSAKYGEKGFPTLSRADLNEEQVKEGCRLAEKCYQYVGCQGMTRVDFFLDEQGEFWLNEMNPIPGFTPISLFPSICQANGMSFRVILDELVVLGLHKHRMKSRREVKVL